MTYNQRDVSCVLNAGSWTITDIPGHVATAVVSNTDPPQLISVAVTQGSLSDSRTFSWTNHPNPRLPEPGNAEVSKSGRTYKFTGNIPPHYNGILAGSPVPFEFDATCP